MDVLFLVLLGLLAAVLLTPLRLRAWGAAGELELWGRFEARWGPLALRMGTDLEARASVVGIPFRLRTTRTEPEAETEEKPRARRWPSVGRLGELRRDGRAIGAMLRQGLRVVHLRLEIHGTMGLDDPADTATARAVAELADDALPAAVRLDLRDHLLEDRTQLGGAISARAIPAQLALLVITWLVRADTRRVLRGMRPR
jgi:hypothetical protein